jgi:hypothetical protein
LYIKTVKKNEKRGVGVGGSPLPNGAMKNEKGTGQKKQGEYMKSLCQIRTKRKGWHFTGEKSGYRWR